MKPGHIVQRLYPAISQCKTLDAETLKREKPQLIQQLNIFKVQFDKEFQTLINELSSIPQEVLLRGIMGEPSMHQSRKVSSYFIEHQTDISTKIAKLTEIHSDIATQYTGIMCKVDYVNVTPLVARPSLSTAMPQPRIKYPAQPYIPWIGK